MPMDCGRLCFSDARNVNIVNTELGDVDAVLR